MHCEHSIPSGDFNVTVDDPYIKSFCKSYRFKSLIRDLTCFENPENFSHIDLILTNSPLVKETSFTDFHQIINSFMKTNFQKLKSKVGLCRVYNGFSNEDYKQGLLQNLSLDNIYTNSRALEKFLQNCIIALNQMVPKSKKYICGNGMSFFNKELFSEYKKQNKNIYSKQQNSVFLY